jgi:hypothetical protein
MRYIPKYPQLETLKVAGVLLIMAAWGFGLFLSHRLAPEPLFLVAGVFVALVAVAWGFYTEKIQQRVRDFIDWRTDEARRFRDDMLLIASDAQEKEGMVKVATDAMAWYRKRDDPCTDFLGVVNEEDIGTVKVDPPKKLLTRKVKWGVISSGVIGFIIGLTFSLVYFKRPPYEAPKLPPKPAVTVVHIEDKVEAVYYENVGATETKDATRMRARDINKGEMWHIIRYYHIENNTKKMQVVRFVCTFSNEQDSAREHWKKNGVDFTHLYPGQKKKVKLWRHHWSFFIQLYHVKCKHKIVDLSKSILHLGEE